MKNLKSIIFYSICVLVSTRLLNAKGYVELKNGFCHPSHRDGMIYTTPYCLSGEIGYSFHVWRFGIQVNQYNNFKTKKLEGKYHATIYNNDGTTYIDTKFNLFSSLVNVYYDHKIQENFEIYFGLGVGLAKLKYHFFEIQVMNKCYDLSENVWCAQIMAGITYDINAQWALSLGYRCMKTENVYYSHEDFVAGQDIISLKTPYLHSLELGLRYSF